MAHDREVAGIRCSQVLEHLSGYIDGELSAALSANVEAHLRDCDWCEKLGTEMGSVVREIRARLAVPEDISSEVSDRLMARLARVSVSIGEGDPEAG